MGFLDAIKAVARMNEKNNIIDSFLESFKYKHDDILTTDEVERRVDKINMLKSKDIDSLNIKEFENDLILLSNNILLWKKHLLEKENLSNNIKIYLSEINETKIEETKFSKIFFITNLKILAVLNIDNIDKDILIGLEEIDKNINDYKRRFKKINFIYNLYKKSYSKAMGKPFGDFIERVEHEHTSYYDRIKLTIAYKEAIIEIDEFLKKYYNDIKKLDFFKNNKELNKDILFEKVIKKLNVVFLKDSSNIIEKDSLNKHHIVSSILFEELRNSGLKFNDLKIFGFEIKKNNSSKLEKLKKVKIKNDLIKLYEENYSDKSFISKKKLELEKKLKNKNTYIYILYHNGEAKFSSILEKNKDEIHGTAFNSSKDFQNYGFGFWFFEKILIEFGEDYDITCEVNHKITPKDGRNKSKILTRTYGKYGFEESSKNGTYINLIRKKAKYNFSPNDPT